MVALYIYSYENYGGVMFSGSNNVVASTDTPCTKLLSPFKETVTVVMANALEYYDFLLIVHIGPLVIHNFFVGYSDAELHVINLSLFGMAFAARPLGGYVLGRIADLYGRSKSLILAVQYASLPSILIAILPSSEYLGGMAVYIFVLLRFVQGLASASGYSIAGTYLIEKYAEQDGDNRRSGFASALVVASASIGSILGVLFSYICNRNMETMPWLWRFAFMFGGICGIISYYMRKVLSDAHVDKTSTHVVDTKPAEEQKPKISIIIFIICFCATVSTANWIPLAYTNYYLTKVVHMPTEFGLLASAIALIHHMFFTVLSGWVSDRVDNLKYYTFSTIYLIITYIVGVYLLINTLPSDGISRIYIIQLLFITAASCFGSLVHKWMNRLVPRQYRGRYLGLSIMAGFSIGGLAPSVFGMFVAYFDFKMIPAAMVTVLATGTYLFRKQLKVQ